MPWVPAKQQSQGGRWVEAKPKTGMAEDVIMSGLQGLRESVEPAAQIGRSMLAPLANAPAMLGMVMGGEAGQNARNMATVMRRAPDLAGTVARGGRAPVEDYEPQTLPGRVSRGVGQNLIGAALPGTVTARLAGAVLPTVASEAAGEVTKGKPYEQAARMGAAVAGQGLVSLGTRPPPVDRILARSTQPATDAQIRAARQLQEAAQLRGVRLTQPEALQQVTDNATNMGRIQRVMEGTPEGAQRFTPIMSERPQQVMRAVEQYADTVAPRMDNPSMLGMRGQAAADEALTAVRQGVNANARPFYDALSGETMPPAAPAWIELSQNPAYQQGLAAVRNDPILNRDIANLPDENLSVVNEVVKQLRTLGENAAPNPASQTGNAQLSAAFGSAANQADELASAFSEPWRLARGMVSSGREAFLTPLQAGPLGRMSSTPDTTSQLRAMFPTRPLEGGAAETAQAAEILGPDLSNAMLRQHIMGNANETMQNLQSGQNQWGGAKLAAVIAGNPEQQRALMSVAPDANDLGGLIDVLSATGRRQAQGSQTAYNIEDLKTLGESGFAGSIAQTGANLPGTLRRAGDWLKDNQMRRNVSSLADVILADPATAEAAIMRARNSATPAGADLARILIALQSAREQPDQ